MKKNDHITRRRILTGMAACAAGLAGVGAWSAGSTAQKPLSPVQPVSVPETEARNMTLRVNPKSGDAVSLLGFGCMRYPVMPGESSPRSPNIDEKKATELIDYALAHGVNYFDTAWGYHNGASETFTGKALKRHPRDAYFLATKMPSYLNPTLAKAKEIFFRQLEKCQVEYFDYYLLHTLSTVERYQQTYEKEHVLDFLLEQKRAGRIRNLGWSFHGDSAMLEYVLSRDVDWDFAMIQVNYHDLLYKYIAPARMNLPSPAPVRWMYDLLCRSGLPLIVMEPLLGGRLARLNRTALSILQTMHPEATAASWAMRFVGGLPNILTVLSGMTYPEHLRDNLHAFAPLVPLSGEEQAVLKKALDAFIVMTNIRCTTCGYCMPCPYGVDIPRVFRLHNDCIDDNLVRTADGTGRDTMDAETAHAQQVYLARLAKALPESAGAGYCTGCGTCVSKCPQFINIPEEMAKISRYIETLRNTWV